MSTVVIWSKSKPDVEFQYGERLGKFHGMSSQSHISHCRVLPFGEFSVVIPEPHATLQSIIIPSAILKIVFRHILFYFRFFNAVWALTSGGFRIVSDTLVSCMTCSLACRNAFTISNGKARKCACAVRIAIKTTINWQFRLSSLMQMQLCGTIIN